MLTCFYDMRAEVEHFFEYQGKHDLLQSFTSKEFHFHWHTYLVDIFESLNRLNLLLQGKNTNRTNDCNVTHAFMAKLRLWYRRVHMGNVASFPNLDAALEKNEVDLEGQLKSKVESHIQLLKQEFEHFFPDLDDSKFLIWKMT